MYQSEWRYEHKWLISLVITEDFFYVADSKMNVFCPPVDSQQKKNSQICLVCAHDHASHFTLVLKPVTFSIKYVDNRYIQVIMQPHSLIKTALPDIRLSCV